jgi:hypothetical protein
MTKKKTSTAAPTVELDALQQLRLIIVDGEGSVWWSQRNAAEERAWQMLRDGLQALEEARNPPDPTFASIGNDAWEIAVGDPQQNKQRRYHRAVELVRYWGGKLASLGEQIASLEKEERARWSYDEATWTWWRKDQVSTRKRRIAHRLLVDLVKYVDPAWVPPGRDELLTSHLVQLLDQLELQKKPPKGKHGPASLLAKLHVALGKAGAMGLQEGDNPEVVNLNRKTIEAAL